MADKIEHELAAGIEEDMAVRSMAEKLAPRDGGLRSEPLNVYSASKLASSGTVEAKLQAIERLVGEIRMMSAQIKGLIG